MNKQEKIIDNITKKYLFLFNEEEYLLFRKSLVTKLTKEDISDYEDIVENEIKKHIENINYDDKLKILNRYINKMFINNTFVMSKIYNVVNLISIISLDTEKEKLIFDVLNNYNLKMSLNELIKNNKIDLSNIRSEYKTDDFYMLFEMFCEENQIEIKYDDDIETDICDISQMYLNEIGEIKVLPKEEIDKLIVKYKEGDINAKNKIIESNLKLVLPVAGRFYSVYKVFDFNDLIQEGNIALIKAVNNYRINPNCRFSTYATYCINNHLIRYVLNNNRNVKFPINVCEDIKKVKKVINYLQSEYLRQPTCLEIANELKLSEKYVSYLLSLNKFETSLNKRIIMSDQDEPAELIDYIVDNIENVEKEALDSIEENEIKKIISSKNISKRDWDIFLSHNDLGLNDKENLRSLAKKYNITYEAVRQIEARVRRKLMEDRRLQQYYDEDEYYVNNKYKLEFIDEDNFSKFDYLSKLKFKNGFSMPRWFYSNKSKIENSDSKVDKKIMEQYEEYVQVTNESKLTLIKK